MEDKKLLDASGNSVPLIPQGHEEYVKFGLEFGVAKQRMLDLGFVEFRDEVKANLTNMSHMLLDEVLAARKKALAESGSEKAVAGSEVGEPKLS